MTNLLNQADKKTLAEIIKFWCEDAPQSKCSSLYQTACKAKDKHYKNKIYLRGLIEFSNNCKNNCYYCGIQNKNSTIKRYRLSKNEILSCCETGYNAGLRTFVLQSGEDAFYTDDKISSIIYEIKSLFPDCAVTLSIGERSRNSYKKLYSAGADRYLLRHETANKFHYGKLHPPGLFLENRKRCLYDLKEIGFQVGAGFMVNSPFQTFETIADDFIFLRELKPHMIGMGPFIPHKATIFADFYMPSAKNTLILLSLIRIMLPKVLLPATTALATIDKKGYEKGLRAGANVIMPNLTPLTCRKSYAIYDNKLCADFENGFMTEIMRHIAAAGQLPSFDKGDHIDFKNGGYSNE